MGISGSSTPISRPSTPSQIRASSPQAGGDTSEPDEVPQDRVGPGSAPDTPELTEIVVDRPDSPEPEEGWTGASWMATGGGAPSVSLWRTRISLPAQPDVVQHLRQIVPRAQQQASDCMQGTREFVEDNKLAIALSVILVLGVGGLTGSVLAMAGAFGKMR